jgi:hypothetical protein
MHRRQGCNSLERKYFENLEINERMLLIWISKEQDRRQKCGFIFVRNRTIWRNYSLYDNCWLIRSAVIRISRRKEA